MKNLVAILVAAAALGIGCGNSSERDDERAVRHRPLPASLSQSARAALPGARVPPSAESARVSAVDLALGGECTFRVRFLDVLRIPIGGVTLIDDRTGAVCGQSDSTGRARFLRRDERPAERQSEPLSFSTYCPGFARTELRADIRRGGEVDLGEKVLRAGGDLSGLIADDRGEAVEGARVVATVTTLPWPTKDKNRLFGPERPLCETQSDGEGRFCLRGLPVGFVRVWAKAPGVPYSYTGPIEVRGGEETYGLSLTLEH